MKIAMIGQKGVPSRAGGIEIHVGEIAKRLAQKGHEVHVYCRKDYCDTADLKAGGYDGIKLHFSPHVNTKHLDALTHVFIATLQALLEGCEIFHYHALGPSLLSFIPRLFGRKVVCTVHGLDWKRAKWGRLASRFLKLGEFATAKFSHRTISVSESLVGYYKEKYRKDVCYIPNGVIRPKHESANIIREKYGLEKDGYILFVARLVPEKGVHWLIEAFLEIKTDKKLVISGADSHSDSYVQKLREQAKASSNILFTGFVQGRELDELYSNAYLYVLPSEIEGMPLSLLEAMSYGSCCLVSDLAENKAVVGDLGFTFRKGDSSDLMEKMSELIFCPPKVEEVRQKTGAFVLSRFNWDDTTCRTSGVYQSVYKEISVRKSGLTAAQFDLINHLNLLMHGKNSRSLSAFEPSEGFLEEAGKHGLSEVLYPVLSAIDRRKLEEKMGSLRKKIFGQSVLFFVHLQHIGFVLKALEEKGIPAVVLKGLSIARLYPEPELRGMCDLDILVQPSDWDKAGEVLVSLGFRALEEEDYNPLHVAFGKEGFIRVELHRGLIHTGYLGKRRIEDWDRHIWKCRERAEISEIAFYSLAAEDELINQIAHFASHFVFVGTRLRHLFDMALIIKSKGGGFNWRYMEQTLKGMGLFKFACLLLGACSRYFHVSVGEAFLQVKPGVTRSFMRYFMDYLCYENTRDDFRGWINILGRYRRIVFKNPLMQPVGWAVEFHSQHFLHGLKFPFILVNTLRNIRAINRKLRIIRAFGLLV